MSGIKLESATFKVSILSAVLFLQPQQTRDLGSEVFPTSALGRQPAGVPGESKGCQVFSVELGRGAQQAGPWLTISRPTDNHDLISVKLFQLMVEHTPDEDSIDWTKIEPSVSFLRSPKGRCSPVREYQNTQRGGRTWPWVLSSGR